MKKSKKAKPRPKKAKRRVKKPTLKVRPAPRLVPEVPTLPSYVNESPDTPAQPLAQAGAALRRGDPHAAFDLCREALGTDPQNVDALSLAGVAAFQVGLIDDALNLLRSTVSFAPKHAEAQTNLGNVLAHAGELQEAEAAYRAAMAADPNYAEAAFNLGRLLELAGDASGAAAAYAQALDSNPAHDLAQQGLGNAQKTLGQLAAASDTYQALLARTPKSPEARTNLAAVLQELGDFEAAADECRKALTDAPDLAEARYNLGIALQEQGRFEDAIDAYETVLAAQPDNAAASLNIAYGLQQMDKLDEAAQALDRTIQLDPDFAKAHVNLADLHLQRGDAAEAVAVCDEFLASHPTNTDLMAFKAIALLDAGEPEAAAALINFERFVKYSLITPPDGFATMVDFNTALSDHVKTHPSLSFAPQSHATREARHSGELLSEPPESRESPIAALEIAIRDQVDAYRTTFGAHPDHPFAAHAPGALDLSIWGVVMQAAGHQIPHIHPAAWLSGVYYPKVPDVVAAQAAQTAEHAGWIEFGRPPDHFHNQTQPDVRAIQPAEGLMVLFPSYVYHHTVPFETGGTRISIAFDLIARRQAKKQEC